MNLLCQLGHHDKHSVEFDNQTHNGQLWQFTVCERCRSRFEGHLFGEYGTPQHNIPDGNKQRRERDARLDKIFEGGA